MDAWFGVSRPHTAKQRKLPPTKYNDTSNFPDYRQSRPGARPTTAAPSIKRISITEDSRPASAPLRGSSSNKKRSKQPPIAKKNAMSMQVGHQLKQLTGSSHVLGKYGASEVDLAREPDLPMTSAFLESKAELLDLWKAANIPQEEQKQFAKQFFKASDRNLYRVQQELRRLRTDQEINGKVRQLLSDRETLLLELYGFIQQFNAGELRHLTIEGCRATLIAKLSVLQRMDVEVGQSFGRWRKGIGKGLVDVRRIAHVVENGEHTPAWNGMNYQHKMEHDLAFLFNSSLAYLLPLKGTPAQFAKLSYRRKLQSLQLGNNVEGASINNNTNTTPRSNVSDNRSTDSTGSSPSSSVDYDHDNNATGITENEGSKVEQEDKPKLKPLTVHTNFQVNGPASSGWSPTSKARPPSAAAPPPITPPTSGGKLPPLSHSGPPGSTSSPTHPTSNNTKNTNSNLHNNNSTLLEPSIGVSIINHHNNDNHVSRKVSKLQQDISAASVPQFGKDGEFDIPTPSQSTTGYNHPFSGGTQAAPPQAVAPPTLHQQSVLSSSGPIHKSRIAQPQQETITATPVASSGGHNSKREGESLLNLKAELHKLAMGGNLQKHTTNVYKVLENSTRRSSLSLTNPVTGDWIGADPLLVYLMGLPPSPPQPGLHVKTTHEWRMADKAAILIQAIWRGYAARCEADYFRMKTAAAIVLQSLARQICARRVVRNRRDYVKCATRIQACWRGYQDRKYVVKLRRQEAAVIRLQALARGNGMRLKMQRLKIRKNIEGQSAVGIQRSWRAYQWRNRHYVHHKRRSCALMIQRVFRGYVVRNKYKVQRRIAQTDSIKANGTVVPIKTSTRSVPNITTTTQQLPAPPPDATLTMDQMDPPTPSTLSDAASDMSNKVEDAQATPLPANRPTTALGLRTPSTPNASPPPQQQYQIQYPDPPVVVSQSNRPVPEAPRESLWEARMSVNSTNLSLFKPNHSSITPPRPTTAAGAAAVERSMSTPSGPSESIVSGTMKSRLLDSLLSQFDPNSNDDKYNYNCNTAAAVENSYRYQSVTGKNGKMPLMHALLLIQTYMRSARSIFLCRQLMDGGDSGLLLHEEEFLVGSVDARDFLKQKRAARLIENAYVDWLKTRKHWLYSLTRNPTAQKCAVKLQSVVRGMLIRRYFYKFRILFRPIGLWNEYNLSVPIKLMSGEGGGGWPPHPHHRSVNMGAVEGEGGEENNECPEKLTPVEVIVTPQACIDHRDVLKYSVSILESFWAGWCHRRARSKHIQKSLPARVRWEKQYEAASAIQRGFRVYFSKKKHKRLNQLREEREAERFLCEDVNEASSAAAVSDVEYDSAATTGNLMGGDKSSSPSRTTSLSTIALSDSTPHNSSINVTTNTLSPAHTTAPPSTGGRWPTQQSLSYSGKVLCVSGIPANDPFYGNMSGESNSGLFGHTAVTPMYKPPDYVIDRNYATEEFRLQKKLAHYQHSHMVSSSESEKEEEERNRGKGPAHQRAQKTVAARSLHR